MADGLVCAVCARVLDNHALLGWAHTAQDSPADHPAVPVTRSEVQAAHRCDFCNGDDPQWVVPANSFTAMPGHGSDGDWAACTTCITYIHKGEWSGLAQYAAKQLSKPALPVDPSILRALYRELRKNLRGPPTRLP